MIERREVGRAASRVCLALLVHGLGRAATPPPSATPPPPAASQATPAGSGEVLTIEQVVRLALEGNRDVRNAVLEVANAEDELRTYRTKGLPQFNLYALESRMLDDIQVNVPAGAFGDFPATGPIPAADTDVTTPARTSGLIIGQVSQPLTQIPRVSLAVSQKRASLEIARERLRDQRQTLAQSVRSAYYALLRAQSGLEAKEKTLVSLRELDRVVSARVEQKVELQAGALEVKSRLAQADYNALTLRNSLLSGREQLNRLMGRPIDVAFDVSPVPEMSPYEIDLESARAAALRNRADLKEARLRRRQAEIDHRIKKWDFVPDVSLAYTYVALPDVDLLPKNFTSIGLLLSWEPFDWGRRRHALREARRSVEESENALQDAESLAAIDVGQRFRRLQEARALLEASRLGQEAARAQLKVTTERYAQKAALLKDVLADQERLAEADRQGDEALLSAWTARADLEKALGED